MKKLSTHLMIVVLCFATGILTVAAWLYYQKSLPEQFILPKTNWEPIFFKFINQVTEKGQMPALRGESLYRDDFEIRIWRGFGLSNLEGVILKRTGRRWSALHLKADNYVEPVEKVDVGELEEPKSGWDSFWTQLYDKKLLKLREPSEINCEVSTIDGTSYVVEISQNRVYKTFRYTSGVKKGPESIQMIEIGELIGTEFDDETEKCRKDEWFPERLNVKERMVSSPCLENGLFLT